MGVMATTNRMATSAALAALFSGAAAWGAQPSSAGPKARAVLELRVAPAVAGTPLTAPGGAVHLSLAFTPENGVDLAPVDVGRDGPDVARLVGPDGPSIVWNEGPSTGFGARLSIADAREPALFDDRAARFIQWPIAGWPGEAASGFTTDAQADEFNPAVRRTVEGWLGAQTRTVTPVVLAKYLAARTMTHARPDLEPLRVNAGAGAAVGVRSRGAAGFAASGAGSEFDMLRVYAAALRLAGIPSRVVVGVRVEDDAEASLHAWVEFYLYDERSRDGRWAVVDLVSQRRLAHEPPPLADAWRCFGATDASLLPLYVGVPPAQSRDASVLTPWRVDCEPPCVPLRVEARVVDAQARPAASVAQR